MVETALALVLMLLVSVAIVDCGRYLYAANLVTSLAREGVRLARIEGEPARVESHLKTLAVGLPAGSVRVEMLRESGGVVVRTEHQFTPVAAVLTGGPVRIQAQARLPIVE